MNNIKFTQISETELVVQFAPDTPIDMVHELTKSLLSKGLVEDHSISTITDRYYYKPQDRTNAIADRLIKSLEGMIKGDDNTWHMNKPGARQAFAAQQRKIDAENRAKRAGIKPPRPSVPPQSGPVVIPPGKPNRFVDLQYERLNTPVNTKKNEDEDEDDVEKSGYGPKGAGLYSPADNARRKSSNTGAQTGFGANINTKKYTTIVPAGSQTSSKLKRPQPVKQWTPEQIEEENKKRGLKKTWASHLPFPNAEEEMTRLAKSSAAQSGEEIAANQLANLMMGRNMLGKDAHPMVRAMMAPPPPQPTNEELFGHLVVSEETVKKAEQEWSGALNNFYLEASKPISQRFASEEEEMAYWNSIKVNDRDDGKSGY